MNRRTFLKAGLLTSVPVLLGSYSVFIERYLVQFNEYVIPIKNLPQVFNDFTIVQMTDLHYGFLIPLSFIKKLVQKVNTIPRDIIALTGDYVHERNDTKQIDTIWPLLTKLEAPYGVFSVLGNHDHWADRYLSFHWLNKSGQNIEHQSKKIEKDGAHIWVGGAGDLWEDELGIDKAFKNVPEKDIKILLSHNPDSIDTFFKTGLDLAICGHTHGGQVNIPLLGAPVLPVKNKKYSHGFIQNSKVNLFISKGIGWAILPIRFNCYPEVSILKLKSIS